MRDILKDCVFHFARLSGLMLGVRQFFAGSGCILMFHEIHEDPQSELMTGTTPRFLEYAIEWLRQHGWEIVDLDEAVRRLSGEGPNGRFVVLTFDDGYRDNKILALPILERQNAPFTIYVPSGALTRTLPSWWLQLRTLFRSREAVAIEAMGRRFACSNTSLKIAYLRQVTNWVHQDYRRIPMLESVFLAANISASQVNEVYFMDTEELKLLAQHPLVSIAAHTTSHAALKTLDDDSARDEMLSNRLLLENLVQKSISHFAYPYGNAGVREAAIASDLGFTTAVTTRHGQLKKADITSLHLLPRVAINPDETPTSFDARVSGLQSAILRSVGR